MDSYEFRAWDGEKLVYDSPGFWVLTRYDHSVCSQFIGLFDKHGKKIFKDDIVEINTKAGKTVGVIRFANAQFYFAHINKYGIRVGITHLEHWYYDEKDNIIAEIIGNIYENPELAPGLIDG